MGFRTAPELHDTATVQLEENAAGFDSDEHGLMSQRDHASPKENAVTFDGDGTRILAKAVMTASTLQRS